MQPGAHNLLAVVDDAGDFGDREAAQRQQDHLAPQRDAARGLAAQAFQLLALLVGNRRNDELVGRHAAHLLSRIAAHAVPHLW